MYRLLLTNSARRDLDRLRGATWKRVRDALLALREEPRPPGCRSLRGGAGACDISIDDYRAVYDIDDEAEAVTMLRVRHRRDVCRDLLRPDPREGGDA